MNFLPFSQAHVSDNAANEALEKARQQFEKRNFSVAQNILKAWIPHSNPEVLMLGYEVEKKLGRFRSAFKLLQKLQPFVGPEKTPWFQTEWQLCRKKIRHSNADTLLFFGVCFTSFYITARFGMNYRNDYFLWAGFGFFFGGFALRRFYYWDK
ncbi:MAG: hypothetical protein N2050_04350 [Flavobacteriales bacterium]|nr:hypothetical protein [Flavobacteriales bacterium]